MTNPMKVSLLITADAKGVTPATAETRKGVRGIGQEAKATATALQTFAAANDQAAAASRRATEAAIGQSKAERDLRDAVSRFAGVRSQNDNFSAQRAADIAAYGQELDRLRGKFNPVFAEIQRYKAAQMEIRDAHRIGAISVDEMSAALGRERQAALSSIAALKGRQAALHGGAAGGGFGTSSSFNTSNLASQGFDIASTSAFMPFYTVALQQGPQVAQVFNDIRASGASIGPTVAAAFMQLVNPISLVTIAVIGATAAAVQWATSSGDAAQKAEERMEAYLQTVEDLGAAYGRSGSAAEQFGARTVAQLEAAERLARVQLELISQEQQKSLLGSLSDYNTGQLVPEWMRSGDIQGGFAPFRDAIDELRQGLRAGKPDFDAFERSLNDIAATDPSNLQFWADRLISMAGASARSTRLLEDTADGLRDLSNINPSTAKAQQQITAIGDVAEKTTTRLRDLLLQGMAISKMLDGMDALARNVAPKGDAPFATNPIGARAAMDRAQGEFDSAMEFQRRINPDLFDKIDPNKLKKPKVDRDANAYRDLIKSADDRIAQLRTEISLMGDYSVGARRMQIEQELMSQATDKGRQLDEKQIAAIRGKAAALADLEMQLSATRLEQDLMFEREQMFRSPTEQRVHSELRGAGVDPNSDRGRQIADQIRLNDELEIGRDLAGDFTSTLFGDLSRGATLVEALTNAFGRLGDRLMQMALDAALNALFAKLAAALGGSVSLPDTVDVVPTPRPNAIGNAFTSAGITRFAKGGAFTNQVIDTPTLFRFAKGTQLGELGEAGPEAILPLKRNNAGQLGVVAAGGGGSAGFNVTIINQASNVVQASARPSIDGQSLEVHVREIARQEADQNFHEQIGPTMSSGFGLSTMVPRRF
jgi:hypothetical protein